MKELSIICVFDFHLFFVLIRLLVKNRKSFYIITEKYNI